MTSTPLSSSPGVLSYCDNDEMYVTKRDGKTEEISFNKILTRIKKIGNEENIKINYTNLAMKVIDQLFNNITTTEIDNLTCEQCASMSSIRPEYNILASRIAISNHHKNTSDSFFDVVSKLYHNIDHTDKHSPIVTEEFFNIVEKHKHELEEAIDYKRDNLIDFFGFKTLERAYLIRVNGIIQERPQHMWMRVSIEIHKDDIESVIESYNLLSQKYFTHGTPTLFNSGTLRPQLSSCFLLGMNEDSIQGIYHTLSDCALISKWAGGIGLHIHNVRASGSHIRGTNGTSNGIVPMLRVFNNTAKYVDQGGGKRNGSFAIYIEPWHSDIELFLQMRKNHGDEELKARDLFYALWIPDLFMKRVKEDGQWTLMCPDECPGLSDVFGENFDKLYCKYENENKGKNKISARKLWFDILDSQMETGTPYLLFKDSVNRKTNQKNVGIIKSSNLCTEITEFSNSEETAVCNLASIALPAFVINNGFDYDKLHEITKVVTNNLNKIIDANYYPTEKGRKSNFKHRPIGIGVQGLADVFMMLNIPFHSEQAKHINKQIFETIYHAALEKSNEIAIKRYHEIHNIWFNSESHLEAESLLDNYLNEYEKETITRLISKESTLIGAYSTFEGSPAHQGILQYDMWNVKPSDKYDWSILKDSIIKYGIRNALLLAPMPTASTSQILGYNECFEPLTSNIYNRRTNAGEFIVANKYMMKDLIELNIWNEDVKNSIIANQGSIQHIESIPQTIKDKYKTVWEIPMKHIIDMSADRGAFICQSQSLNLWIEDPNYNNLTSMHFYSWGKGLKTGIYYLRRRAAHKAQQFTIEPEKKKNDSEEPCEMCSG